MEPMYQRYQERLQHSQFVVYLLMQTGFSMVCLIIAAFRLEVRRTI